MMDRIKTPAERVSDIIEQVAAKFYVSPDEMLGQSRRRAVVKARHVAIVRVKEDNPKMAISRLGAIFNRDHSTILYALDIPCRRRKVERDKAARRHKRARLLVENVGGDGI